ncbi:MAG: gamma-butyrobetaine hydroxylase-like domain-containing protein [Steroidobacteraceae bacterium]
MAPVDSPLSPSSASREAPGNPLQIKLRRTARLLEVTFEDGSRFELPFEYLRVHSPSAEVKGHGPGQETLVLGKEAVGVRAIEPVGQYAVKLVFDDGHDTGLYTWKYLYELGRDRQEKWARYLARVEALKPSWKK